MFNLFFKKKEIKTKEDRRSQSNSYIKSCDITCFEELPCIFDASEVKMKSLDLIAKKVIASILVIQVIYDIQNDNYKEAKEIVSNLLEQYGVSNMLNSKELRVMNGTYTEQDLIDMDWEYETVWALLYVLGLVDDIKNSVPLCNCDYVISIINNNRSVNEFKRKCKLRNIEDVLDMLDLYYRYHWATTEKRIRPDTNIGNLDSSSVIERRRGLEWVFSDTDDWYNIELDT